VADYKQMYFMLPDATEKAINELVAAQRACEELYIQCDEAEKLTEIRIEEEK
jgi:hypothetical protein